MIADFAHATLMTPNPPHGLLELTATDLQSYFHQADDPSVLTSLKRFAQFLLDTGRINYDAGEDLQAHLKVLHKSE